MYGEKNSWAVAGVFRLGNACCKVFSMVVGGGGNNFYCYGNSDAEKTLKKAIKKLPASGSNFIN